MTTYARRLGVFSATMAVVGGVIGGGIFRSPAEVAARVGSAGLTLAVWVLGGLVALAGAFCYGELGARMPRAGGQYVYATPSARSPRSSTAGSCCWSSRRVPPPPSP